MPVLLGFLDFLWKKLTWWLLCEPYVPMGGIERGFIFLGVLCDDLSTRPGRPNSGSGLRIETLARIAVHWAIEFIEIVLKSLTSAPWNRWRLSWPGWQDYPDKGKLSLKLPKKVIAPRWLAILGQDSGPDICFRVTLSSSRFTSKHCFTGQFAAAELCSLLYGEPTPSN